MQLDGIGRIRGHGHHIGLAALDLEHQRTQVGAVGRIALVQDDLHALRLELGAQRVRHVLTPVGVFIHQCNALGGLAGQLARIGDEVGHALGITRCRHLRRAEDILETPLRDVGLGSQVHHPWHSVLFRHGGCREGRAALEGAQQHGDLFAGHQALHLGDRHLGVAPRVGLHQLQLGPAQRLDAAGFVDVLHRQVRGARHVLADGGGRAARKRNQIADLHRVGGVRRAHAESHDRAGQAGADNKVLTGNHVIGVSCRK